MTFASLKEPRVLLQRLGVSPGTIAVRGQADNFDEDGDEIHPDFDEAFDSWGGCVVRAGTYGGWAWSDEASTSWSANPEVTCTASVGGTAVSLHYNIKSMAVLNYAEDGVLVTAINTWKNPPLSGHAGRSPRFFDEDIAALGGSPGAETVEGVDAVELFFSVAEARFGVGLTYRSLVMEPVLCGEIAPG
ncbi:DUF6461 domain-containing protein [Yinghuangia sp. YIM S09857]|uniref:DUF6461 domain-containing protein n=1 Tax=Yinghuangia sp. YIM S09857 TaxID=3436929 RepID=UPI003F5368E4